MKAHSNIIPKGRDAVTILGRAALRGILESGEEAGLFHNTASGLAADLHAYAGMPDVPGSLGERLAYGAKVVALKNAYVVKTTAIKAGREFCRLAISLLKPALGNAWNTNWRAAGFQTPSLAVPRQPLALLTALRSFFADRAALENAPANVTAAQATALASAIDAAVLAVGAARAARVSAKRAHDAAFKRLRKRLSSLRAELEQLLPKDDGRWAKFGFHRPADGRMPAPVAEVTATRGGPGIVLVSWPAAPLAEKYRVTWWPEGNPDLATEAALTSDPRYALTGLPPGIPITIGVSAKNRSGETAPTRVALALESA